MWGLAPLFAAVRCGEGPVPARVPVVIPMRYNLRACNTTRRCDLSGTHAVVSVCITYEWEWRGVHLAERSSRARACPSCIVHRASRIDR